MTTQPSRYVQPEISEARVARLWSGISERLERRPSPVWRWAAASGAVLTGAVLTGAVLLTQPARLFEAPRAAVLAEAELETASDGLSVTLADGSALELESRTRVAVRGNQPQAVALVLEQGEVTFNVTHRPERKFTVVAGGVEVRVMGTQFSVKATPAASGERVEVNVVRGLVEVRSARQPGVVARVAAGQSWIQNAEMAPPPIEVARSEPALSASEVAPAPPEPEERKASAAATGAGATSAAAAAGAAAASAKELFEKAGEHRRAGDARSAAQAYEELLRRHGSDSRAGLSAFELGRLRMDRLSDLAGAAQALERALSLGVGSSFREDALARLVSVYAAQGQVSACERARSRYLQNYPAGVHAGAVATRCGAR
jgi:TolA-binding protein